MVPLSIPDVDHRTPLHSALRYGECSNVMMKILNLTPDIHLRDGFGQSPLLNALENIAIRSEIIIELIKRGLSCSESDNDGNTALHIALKNRHPLQVIKAIVNEEINVNARNNKDETPIF